MINCLLSAEAGYKVQNSFDQVGMSASDVKENK